MCFVEVSLECNQSDYSTRLQLANCLNPRFLHSFLSKIRVHKNVISFGDLLETNISDLRPTSLVGVRHDCSVQSEFNHMINILRVRLKSRVCAKFALFHAKENRTFAQHLRMKRNNVCTIFRIVPHHRQQDLRIFAQKSKLFIFICANSKIAHKATFFA